MWEDPGARSTHAGSTRWSGSGHSHLVHLASLGGRKQWGTVRTHSDIQDEEITLLRDRPGTASAFPRQTLATSAACDVLLRDFLHFLNAEPRLCRVQAPVWAHLCVAAVKRWSVHRQSL